MTSITDLTPGTWTVDPTHSELSFSARHLMVSKVRGKFSDFSGTIEVKEPVTDSVVTATAKLASIDTGNADRDGHVRGEDFFDVEKNPDMTFVSTSVSDSELAGHLTIKGITKPVVFAVDFNGVATDPWGNTKAGFEATAEINRKDWDLNWNAALEGGGVLVSETIKIALDIELAKG